MRGMAGDTFAVLHGLVLDLGVSEGSLRLFVAVVTDLTRFAPHLLRILGFVAGRAFALGVRRVFDQCAPRRRDGGLREGIGVRRSGPVHCDRGIRGCARIGNAIKEGCQPLVLGLGAAAHQQRQTAKCYEPAPGAATMGTRVWFERRRIHSAWWTTRS